MAMMLSLAWAQVMRTASSDTYTDRVATGGPQNIVKRKNDQQTTGRELAGALISLGTSGENYRTSSSDRAGPSKMLSTGKKDDINAEVQQRTNGNPDIQDGLITQVMRTTGHPVGVVWCSGRVSRGPCGSVEHPWLPLGLFNLNRQLKTFTLNVGTDVLSNTKYIIQAQKRTRNSHAFKPGFEPTPNPNTSFKLDAPTDSVKRSRPHGWPKFCSQCPFPASQVVCRSFETKTLQDLGTRSVTSGRIRTRHLLGLIRTHTTPQFLQ
ncbi:hypothetical protein Bbelb_229030 [Branchiostoma belcheri]|nr:hypothetical protein Bbelb_229030 [Branchiostoma belcheri]